MAAYVLIHGGGGSGWDWHLVAHELRQHGHDVVAPDLLNAPGTGLRDQADAVVEAVGDRADVVVAGHSLGGFVAPLVAESIGADLLVLVAAMVPAPGESASDWWANTEYASTPSEEVAEGGLDPTFFHDVPESLGREAVSRESDVSERSFEEPWPLKAWPSIPTHVLVAADDRMFPADFQRRVVSGRLGITPDEIPGGHYLPLGRPVELAERLEKYRLGQSA